MKDVQILQQTMCPGLHVSEGFKEAAEKFRQEAGVTPPVELDALDDRIRLRSLVQNGQIQEAINLVNNLYPELLDKYRYLYFRLQVGWKADCVCILCPFWKACPFLKLAAQVWNTGKISS